MAQQNKINLEGRHAIVTGAAQGFGLAITKRFVESGANVSMWDIDGEELADAATAFGGKVATQICDVTDIGAIDQALVASGDAFGTVEILVNNAGIAGPNDVVWNYGVEDWRRIVELDMNAVFYCCRAVIPHMISQNYGRVVNIASIAGKEGNANAAAYSTAKAGVIALTKSLGKELAAYNIAVNCITPAAARTRIFDQMSEEHIDMMLSKIPRGRFVEVDEVAAMAAWMASEENRFTTGGVFDISGGRATY
ncbi:MAG TPA: SDR family NAD(P)-dependent oxidoreductase [Alphaproteobacteria bacterium]|nr:SDR family NAD(P)-dependent oxidoreductase [Alphaproteobacteria bacterium]